MIRTVCSWEQGALIAEGRLNMGAGVIIDLNSAHLDRRKSRELGNLRMGQAWEPFQWNVGQHGTQKRYRGVRT